MTQTEIIKQTEAFLEPKDPTKIIMTAPQGQAIVQMIYDIWRG